MSNKEIIFEGKKAIDSFKGKDERIRVKCKNWKIKDYILGDQLDLIKKIYMNYQGDSKTYNDYKEAEIIVKRELKSKWLGYKQQDKDRFDLERLITEEELMEKLVGSKLKCYYCKKDVLLLFEKVRENLQWTLDRIDNDIGHEYENVVIACLKCNLQRRRMDDEKFKFTKQLKITKIEK